MIEDQVRGVAGFATPDGKSFLDAMISIKKANLIFMT